MKTVPFISTLPPDDTLTSGAARLPYHDRTDCAEGQLVRQSGHWVPYEPTSRAETRPRCPVCRALDKQ